MTEFAPGYYCDKMRHLICVPFSVSGLHRMADELGIARDWFSNPRGKKKPHYDIPKLRIAEIQAKCTLITPQEVLGIIKAYFDDGVDDFTRASGDAICSQCGKPYKRHPFDTGDLFNGSPYLNVLCDGTKVKL